ncbi:uncharacterized protein LOC144907889 [Branchiostoma floridae x Branchiostoma belcheri]
MATYSPLPTEEPEPTFAQPGTDKDDRKDKETSVNISASCSTNNFCTGRRMYMLLVAGIVCIFVFVAVYQTVLKAAVVVAAVSVIVVISYVIYNYVNKRASQTTQKDDGAYANEKKQENTKSPKMNTGNIENAACEEETLHDSKTSEEDDVEIIDSIKATGHGLQSNPVIITEVDTSSDEAREDSLRPSVLANQSLPLPFNDRLMALTTGAGVALATFAHPEDYIAADSTIAFSRYTRLPIVSYHGMYFIQDDMEPCFDVIAKGMPADWQQLARNLGVPWEQIRAVNREHSGDCWMCCQQVLNTWLKTNGRRATKEKLIQAVKETGHQDVVDKLEDEFD